MSPGLVLAARPWPRMYASVAVASKRFERTLTRTAARCSRWSTALASAKIMALASLRAGAVNMGCLSFGAAERLSGFHMCADTAGPFTAVNALGGRGKENDYSKGMMLNSAKYPVIRNSPLASSLNKVYLKCPPVCS